MLLQRKIPDIGIRLRILCQTHIIPRLPLRFKYYKSICSFFQKGGGKIQTFLRANFPESSQIKTVYKNASFSETCHIHKGICRIVYLKFKLIEGWNVFLIAFGKIKLFQLFFVKGKIVYLKAEVTMSIHAKSFSNTLALFLQQMSEIYSSHIFNKEVVNGAACL